MKKKIVEHQIWAVEELLVVIKYNGRAVRSDYAGLPKYPWYERKANNATTVAQWKEQRFYPAYEGYEVDVLDGNDNICNGHTQLGSVRETYYDE